MNLLKRYYVKRVDNYESLFLSIICNSPINNNLQTRFKIPLQLSSVLYHASKIKSNVIQSINLTLWRFSIGKMLLLGRWNYLMGNYIFNKFDFGNNQNIKKLKEKRNLRERKHRKTKTHTHIYYIKMFLVSFKAGGFQKKTKQ